MLERSSRGVYGSGSVACRELLCVESTATFDSLHFLPAPVADGARTFRAGSPFLDTLAILVATGLAALTADALTGGIRRWITTASDGRSARNLPCGGSYNQLATSDMRAPRRLTLLDWGTCHGRGKNVRLDGVVVTERVARYARTLRDATGNYRTRH